jgi:hypothetical protein
MSNNKPERQKAQHEPFRPQQVLQWAMCHPGVMLLSSLAVGTLLAWRREINHQTIADRRAETEADITDDDIPLFI